jgi:hypothetical protein
MFNSLEPARQAEILRTSSVDVLERVYVDAPVAPLPRAHLRGQVLGRVDTPFARSAAVTALLVPFERLSFGVDFTTSTWSFVHPRIRLGRFRVEPGRSRWRDTDTLRLRYDVSRLPFRDILYDEVKPLDGGICLGLGGIDYARGRGDLFFFLLALS